VAKHLRTEARSSCNGNDGGLAAADYFGRGCGCRFADLRLRLKNPLKKETVQGVQRECAPGECHFVHNERSEVRCQTDTAISVRVRVPVCASVSVRRARVRV